MSRTKRLFPSLVALLVIGLGTGVYLRSDNYFNGEKAAKIDLSAIDIRLKCLSENSIETVRNFGSIDVLIPQCSQELWGVLGDEFQSIGDGALRAILATVVAANFAEYGASSAASYEEISKSSQLNCSNANYLVGYLLGGLESENLKPIGFDGGFIGNHAQLLFNDNGKTVLLDPTAGIIAKTSFNDLLRGVPLDKKSIRAFSIRAKRINSFREKVYVAINHGKYLPSDFMYMHESLAEQMTTMGQPAGIFFTPGGITLRARLKNQS
jgi:hypothetical protein